MRYAHSRIVLSVLLSSALVACGSKPLAVAPPPAPPAADLIVVPKPVPPDAIVTSEVAAAEYGARLEGWGERGWAQVARLCRWARANRAAVECPGTKEAPE